MSDTWDSIADWYADHVNRGSAMHQFACDVLLEALPADMSGQRMLDLGCGEGLITRAAAGRGGQVVGVDPTVRLIERARAIEAGAATGATAAPPLVVAEQPQRAALPPLLAVRASCPQG